MEEQDVYCAQFVNLKIFTFVQIEKKLLIYFPLFPSVIKSSIFTNGLTSLWRLVSEKAHRIWDLKSATLRLSFYKYFENPSRSRKLFKLPRLGTYGPLAKHGITRNETDDKAKKSTCIIRSLSSCNHAFPSGK